MPAEGKPIPEDMFGISSDNDSDTRSARDRTGHIQPAGQVLFESEVVETNIIRFRRPKKPYIGPRRGVIGKTQI